MKGNLKVRGRERKEPTTESPAPSHWSPGPIRPVPADGGIAANKWLCWREAELCNSLDAGERL